MFYRPTKQIRSECLLIPSCCKRRKLTRPDICVGRPASIRQTSTVCASGSVSNMVYCRRDVYFVALKSLYGHVKCLSATAKSVAYHYRERVCFTKDRVVISTTDARIQSVINRLPSVVGSSLLS